MTEDKIKNMWPKDVTGLRVAISALLEDARKKELSDVVVAWRRKDKIMAIYWNGDEFVCNGMANIVAGDIREKMVRIDNGIDCEPLT